MKTTLLKKHWSGIVGVGIILLTSAGAFAASYDLSKVNGMQAFKGSAAAKELLGKNGFVVADPSFKQIFEAYIKSPMTEVPSEKQPMGDVLPAFITTDSAWHTYHVLLEEGVKQLEEAQSARMREFSSKLVEAARKEKADPDLVLFASVGLALQDPPYRDTITGVDKRIVDGLRNGKSAVRGPMGFELSPYQFRAQSFYTQSPELSDYFAARQWYATVVFRLTDPRETRLAVSLAGLINGNPELLKLWNQLSAPYDAFLARPEDGTVVEYANATASVLGPSASAAAVTDAQLRAIQKKLAAELPLPQMSDQLLNPAQYAEYGRQTRGFRLLPPRRLPDSVCFQNTIDPKIRGRMYPSGLDFFAASPVLRSPAAEGAVLGQFGKDVGSLILKTDCGPLPDSLHGQAMQLLATLQKPLPSSVAAPLRTEAWSDLQLWTQLGAWAEQRHTWALQIKMTVSVRGIIEPPKGIVAPYPDFFSGLAKLARQTGEELAKAQSEEQFDVKSAASRLLDLLKVYDQFMHAQNKPEFEAVSAKLTQAFEFHNRYVELHRAEMTITGSLDPFEQVGKDLEAMAQHCAATGQATDAEIKTLQLLDEGRENAAQKLNDFAPVCDRLAALATKSLKGEALTENDTKWIRDYGVTLAGFHFYYGNSYEVPRDDFPMVTRVFSNPLSDAMLYAGLARPQALYVIVPNGNTLQLYRGAVLTYREFVRPNSELLDDESWREMVSKGKTPPAPPFTRSFFAETSVKELLALLLNEGGQADYDYGDIEETLWQIGSRSTATDLPDLIQILSRAPEKSSDGEWSGTSADIQRGIAEVISELPWQSQQDQIITLLASPNYNQASAAALILTRQPALLDPALLTSKFSDQNTHARRLYCAVLATLPQPTADVRQLFQHALHDPESAVRWQAILALAKNGTNDLECQSLLLGMLNDTNQFVGAAAAYSLGRLGATNSAPALLAELKSALSAPAVPVEELQRQSLEIIGDLRREQFQGAKILDPEDLELRLSIEPEVIANMQRRSVMRLAAGPFLHLPNGYYDLATALIDALGDLQYSPAVDELISLSGTDFNSVSRSDYHDAATQALGKLAPDRLADQLMVAITNKQTDSYLREEAMVTLCTVSATNRVRELIPLLDDTTPIEYGRPMPGPSWRVCDRAAETIAIMLGWERNAMPHFATLAQREELMNRARAWAKEQAK